MHSLAMEAATGYRTVALADTAVTERIHLVRGQKVMLDRDLAELYGVETKHLKRQVRRNLSRFPSDFMFELTKQEFDHWRSQNVTSNSGDRMGLRYTPMAFTEQGVAMLSSVLNSERAVQVNISIIRVFTRMREVLLTQKDLLLKVEQLEHAVLAHDKDLDKVFECLKELLTKPAEPRPRIGYRNTN